MAVSPLYAQILSLPAMAAAIAGDLAQQAAALLPEPVARSLRAVYLGGCGDSHHAAVNAELAFRELAGLPCRAAPAMQLGRYLVPALPAPAAATLVVGVSVSGAVSRTIEALALARGAKAVTVALTGHPDTPLAEAGEYLLHAAVPPLPDAQRGLVVPGARSYLASQLALYFLALRLGEVRGYLTAAQASALRGELGAAAAALETTIAACETPAQEAVAAWQDAGSFVYCGSGPQWGTALFSAAKLLEASGDTAVAQETEEWAHLDYFARSAATPTTLISAGARDAGRVEEVARAALAIGRRVALAAPAGSPLLQTTADVIRYPLGGPFHECFAPLVACLPGLLFAAFRAERLDEPYFRAFGGGRSIEEGGGISRIQSSERLDELPPTCRP